MTNSSYAEELSEVSLADAGLFIMAIFLAIFTTSANAATVVAIWRTPALRTLANTYVCSLACADFIVGLACVVIALFMLPPLKLEIFYKHIRMCFFLHGIGLGSMVVSAIHMNLIALDRYLYIMKPYFYERVITIRVISGFIGSTWVAGLAVTFMSQFIGRPYDEVPLCDVTLRQPIWYTFYLTGVIYFLTSICTAVTYIVILKAASRQRKAVRANEVSSTQRSGFIDKGTMKSIRFFFTVFGVFFCCVTPNVIVFGLDYYVYFPAVIYRSVNLLGLTNSAMNFLIYAAMNKDFRKAYLQVLALSRCERYLCCKE